MFNTKLPPEPPLFGWNQSGFEGAGGAGSTCKFSNNIGELLNLNQNILLNLL